MSALPGPESLREYVNSLFTPERRKRALQWAATPDGRDTLAAHREHLQSIPKPVPPTGG